MTNVEIFVKNIEMLKKLYAKYSNLEKGRYTAIQSDPNCPKEIKKINDRSFQRDFGMFYAGYCLKCSEKPSAEKTEPADNRQAEIVKKAYNAVLKELDKRTKELDKAKARIQKLETARKPDPETADILFPTPQQEPPLQEIKYLKNPKIGGWNLVRTPDGIWRGHRRITGGKPMCKQIWNPATMGREFRPNSAEDREAVSKILKNYEIKKNIPASI